MKNKINVKLTVFLVSLFIGLILLILGNTNQYCLSFGFILAGVGLVFYVLYKNEKLDQVLLEVNLEMENLDTTKQEDAYVLQELNKIRTKTTSQKRRLTILFYLVAFVFVVMGFVGFF